MHLAPSWDVCAGAVVLLAIVARAAKAVSWSGAVAGVAVGLAVSAGFGGPGLAVLGTFFVVGTAATKFGYAKKAARGAAEARGGARDWRNVVGKGGVAAFFAIHRALHDGWPDQEPSMFFTAALAAALADTLGTEIGTLAPGEPRSLPLFKRAPVGTPGAVSIAGTAAAAFGAALVAATAFAIMSVNGEARGETALVCFGTAAVAGFLATIAESLLVATGLRVRGFVRNLFTTAFAAILVGLLGPRFVT